MKSCILLLLFCMYTWGAPVDIPKPGSCQDPSALGAAKLALTKINQDRIQGYVLSLNRLCNVNQMPHGINGIIYFLTMDVLETNCHVLSQKSWESCEVRDVEHTPVYGQCKATVFINKVQRIVHLHSYSCTVRPAPASKVHKTCPDCPSLMPLDSETVLKTVKASLEEFNKNSRLSNYFALLNVTRASIQRGIAVFDFVEFTIQETICSNSTDVSEVAKCALMDCEFAHKGHCKGSRSEFEEKDHIIVNCDIYEPEASEREESRHLLGAEHDHYHNHTHDHHHHSHGTEDNPAHHHDHSHDHHHEHAHNHDHSHGHHHEHAHDHDHKHEHSHDHHHQDAHEHDHCHDHSQDHSHTHDCEHKHLHLHVHEHHHHHHNNSHERPIKSPLGIVHYLPSVDQPISIPSLLDQPAAPHGDTPATLPVFPDTHAHGPQEKKLVIPPFPSTISKQCPGASMNQVVFIKELFAEDPLFQVVPPACGNAV
uniref:Fetuin B n=1 Tax=Scleropages formosus TaxID=113540 RepID=A0A8C9S1E1_SCLFO